MFDESPHLFSCSPHSERYGCDLLKLTEVSSRIVLCSGHGQVMVMVMKTLRVCKSDKLRGGPPW
jgi:hypothetical protein